jgi:hypothetical protein
MAVLAASEDRCISDVVREMIHIREVISPRPDRIDRFHESYLLLVEELARRGWIRQELREHAGKRAQS